MSKTNKDIKKNKNITSDSALSGKIHLLAYFLLGVICIILLFQCLDRKFLQDDTYITLRYVKNFVDGNGLVFNIGERVEGYTCFLWVIILSIFAFLKFNLENISQILSLIFGIFSLIVTFKLSELFDLKDSFDNIKKKNILSKNSSANENIKYLLNLVPAIFLALNGGYIFWTISGMETMMFISLSLLGILFYIKNLSSKEVNYKFAIFLFLASLTRPEGIYFFGIIILHKLIITIRDSKEQKINFLRLFFSKENIITYLIYIIPTLLYILFRYSYYGYVFPNTYYAKTGFSEVYFKSGLEYTWKFFSSYLFYGIIFFFPLILFRKKEVRDIVLLFYLIIILFTIYIILIGGDVLKQHRFFLNIAPFIFILWGKVLVEFYYYLVNKVFGGNKNLGVVVILLISFGISYYNFSNQKELLDRDVQTEQGLVEKMKITGMWFKEKQNQAGRKLIVAATTIGALSYYSDVTLIDMLGLTDEEVAHNPKAIPEISSNENIGWKERNYNVDYILSRKPDYIYFSTGVKPSAYAERGLFTVNEFVDRYYPYYISYKNLNFSDVVYKRKSDEEVMSSSKNIVENPNYKKSYVNLFNGALNLSRDKAKLNEAINTMKECIEEAPKNFSQGYQMLGDFYSQLGNKTEALKYYNLAIEASDYNVMSHYALYQYHFEKNDSIQAQIHLEKIKKYDPDIFR